MAIAVNQNYDKAQRKISTNNLAQFAGVDCQLLVEKETHRPIIMDGSTIGGKFKCASTDEVKAVETVANNAISQAYADEHYLGITAKAESAKIADNATNADTAIKASQDANGNAIPETYATKSELTSGLATKQPVGDYRTKSELDSIYLGINAKAKSAETADMANAISGEAVVDIVGVGGGNTITSKATSYELPCDAFVEATYQGQSASMTSNLRVVVHLDGAQIYATAYGNHPRANFNRFIRKGAVLSATANFENGKTAKIDAATVTVYPLVLYAKEVTK